MAIRSDRSTLTAQAESLKRWEEPLQVRAERAPGVITALPELAMRLESRLCFAIWTTSG